MSLQRGERTGRLGRSPSGHWVRDGRIASGWIMGGGACKIFFKITVLSSFLEILTVLKVFVSLSAEREKKRKVHNINTD